MFSYRKQSIKTKFQLHENKYKLTVNVNRKPLEREDADGRKDKGDDKGHEIIRSENRAGKLKISKTKRLNR